MISLLLALLAPATFAQTQAPNAIDDAISLCENFKFDKEQCLTTVNGKEYFQKNLVNLCGGLVGMDSDKITCLGMVGNKIALDSAVQACNKRTWWDNTKPCIISALKPYTPAAPSPSPTPSPTPAPSGTECNKEKAMETLTKAIDLHKRMKYLPLYEALIDLKYLLKNCGF